MKHFYLAAAILGAVVPYVFFLGFFAEHGVVLPEFVAGVFANGAAGGFAADLLITSFVFWVYMFSQKTPMVWVYILVNLGVGLSCAVPLYLWRQAVRAELASQGAE